MPVLNKIMPRSRCQTGRSGAYFVQNLAERIQDLSDKLTKSYQVEGIHLTVAV